MVKLMENFFVRARRGEENGVFVEEVWEGAFGWRGGAYYKMMLMLMMMMVFGNDVGGGVLVDLHD